MRYRVRVKEVEAVQWTGHNLDEVRKVVAPDAYAIESGWTLAVPILVGSVPDPGLASRGIRDYLMAYVGHYVVRTGSGLRVTMSPEHFEATYEEIS